MRNRTPHGAGMVAALLLAVGGCVIDVSEIEVGGDGWDDSQGVEVSGSLSRVVGLAGEGALRLLGTNGTVFIRVGEATREVRIDAVRRVRSRTRDDAEEHLALLRVDVTTGAGEIVVRTLHPEPTGRRTYAVDYQISVPTDVRIAVQNGNGDVTLRGLRAWAGVEVGNGDVVLDAHYAGAQVSLGNGEIRSHVELPPGGELRQSVGNGGIHLTLPRSTSARVTARVGNGILSLSDLDPTIWASSLHAFDGVLGGGEGTIELSVGNGWIRIGGR